MERKRKPDWLKIKIGGNLKFNETAQIVTNHSLCTICVSGKCPNLGECWSNGTATFMICGDICTRSCKFCNTKTGKPQNLDINEPLRIANSIKQMKLRHAVITSVDRDDLSDYGASHWIDTIIQIRNINTDTTIEVLLPDFMGDKILIDNICKLRPDIIAHNIETVARLTPLVRSAAKYQRSLDVLKQFASNNLNVKSGFMVGLGETKIEVLELLDDLVSNGCNYLTIGQYLQPTKNHLPVYEYIHPDIFEELKNEALHRGFTNVESGPLVRSSYHAYIK